VKTDIDLDQWV